MKGRRQIAGGEGVAGRGDGEGLGGGVEWREGVDKHR